MHRSDPHEYRQACNAQLTVCGDGAQLDLATNLVATSADAQSFAETILGMNDTVVRPERMLADTGYASGPAVEAVEAQDEELLVAIGRTQSYRPYDFRPSPSPKTPREPNTVHLGFRCPISLSGFSGIDSNGGRSCRSSGRRSCQRPHQPWRDRQDAPA